MNIKNKLFYIIIIQIIVIASHVTNKNVIIIKYYIVNISKIS